MSYLQRRVAFLIEQFENDTLKLGEEFLQTENGKDFVEDIKKIKSLPDGTVDLNTCSDLVRSISKGVYLFKRMTDQETANSQVPTKSMSPDLISQSMKDYFQMLGSPHKKSGCLVWELRILENAFDNWIYLIAHGKKTIDYSLRLTASGTNMEGMPFDGPIH